MICLQALQCLVFLKVFSRNVWEWRASSSSGCDSQNGVEKKKERGHNVSFQNLQTQWTRSPDGGAPLCVVWEKQHTNKHRDLESYQPWPFSWDTNCIFFPILFPHRKKKQKTENLIGSFRRSEVEVEQNRSTTEDMLTSAAFSPSVIIPLPSSRFPATSHLMQTLQPCRAQHPPSVCPVLSRIHNFSAPFRRLWMSLKDKRRALRVPISSHSVLLRNMHRVSICPPECQTVRKCDIIAVHCLLSCSSFWAGKQPAESSPCPIEGHKY